MPTEKVDYLAKLRAWAEPAPAPSPGSMFVKSGLAASALRGNSARARELRMALRGLQAAMRQHGRQHQVRCSPAALDAMHRTEERLVAAVESTGGSATVADVSGLPLEQRYRRRSDNALGLVATLQAEIAKAGTSPSWDDRSRLQAVADYLDDSPIPAAPLPLDRLLLQNQQAVPGRQ